MTTELRTTESHPAPSADWDPWFDDLRAGLVDAFGIAPFGLAAVGGFPRDGGFRAPRTDVSDTGAAYKIVAELPGIPKEKIDVRIRGTSVEIRGSSEETKESDAKELLHRERRSAAYYRSLELPEPVLANAAKAKLENGLLELELPKQHPTSSDEVQVAVQ